MFARWITFCVWALVAAGAVAWGLKLFVSAPEAPAQAAVADAALAPRGDVTRVLGADAVAAVAAETEAAPDARFQLLGVAAPRAANAAREGVALIAVDGKPARAFRVGARVDGDTVLQAVRSRGADLGPPGGKPTLALNIPPPAPAATGTLPSAVPGGGAPRAVVPAVPRVPAPAAPGTMPGTTGAVIPAPVEPDTPQPPTTGPRSPRAQTR